MREKIAQRLSQLSWKNWEIQYGKHREYYLERADKILKMQCEEIEKVENDEPRGTPTYLDREWMRQKILSLLRPVI